MSMGTDPATSVTDGDGRMHSLPNVVVADGSGFPTAGAHNPTLTIMATALRNARTWARESG
jgi:paromamine 6'-oxidase/6'''-hydroxyneomycin C oxidase/2'-deamino-2'-hydroxyparomamine 6'-oxidase